MNLARIRVMLVALFGLSLFVAQRAGRGFCPIRPATAPTMAESIADAHSGIWHQWRHAADPRGQGAILPVHVAKKGQQPDQCPAQHIDHAAAFTGRACLLRRRFRCGSMPTAIRASCYCALLGGSGRFGGINAAGGNWVRRLVTPPMFWRLASSPTCRRSIPGAWPITPPESSAARTWRRSCATPIPYTRRKVRWAKARARQVVLI